MLTHAREIKCELRYSSDILMLPHNYKLAKRIKHMKPVRIFVITLLLTTVAASGLFINKYSGLMNEAYQEFRHNPLREFKYYIDFVIYFVGYMEKLEPGDNGWVGFDMEEKRVMQSGSLFEQGKMKWVQGDFKNAIKTLKLSISKNGETESKLFWLAISYLREGEEQNCLSVITKKSSKVSNISSPKHNNADYCSLPIKVYHRNKNGSENAVITLKKLLDEYDSGSKMYQWLLNFSYMTLDKFPDGVPSKYLIKSKFIDTFYGSTMKKMQKKYAYLDFPERANQLGINLLDSGKGVAIEDFNRDGYLDIFTVGAYSNAKLYMNDRGIRFIDRTKEAGLSDVAQNHLVSAADYDNDGWIDLFVSQPFSHFRLLRNNQDGTFKDVTFESKLLSKPLDDDLWMFTWISTWADVDNDGDLDLFLGHRGQQIFWYGGYMKKKQQVSLFYINDNGKFIESSEAYGLTDILDNQSYIGAAFGDYDNDGYIDLFISSSTRHKSKLLRNINGKRFEETNLARNNKIGFMAGFVDINHDGKLDLFQGGGGLAFMATDQAVFGMKGGENGNTIFMNTGKGFEERFDLFKDNMMVIGSMGASYGDLNNDGCVDFYMGTGDPEGWHVLPNLMYIGETKGTKCTGYMDNISMLHGFGTTQKGHGIVFFDFDNDGDQDIYSSLGGMFPADVWPNQMFVNNSKLDNSWIKIRLRGHRSNSFGIGARIKVIATNDAGNEIIRHYYMNNKTGFGSAPYLAHIGLMNATAIKRVEVIWPGELKPKYYKAKLRNMNLLDENKGMATVPSKVSR